MVDNSHQIYVLADSTKLGLESSQWWTPLERPWHLITDDGATEAQLKPFRDLGTWRSTWQRLCRAVSYAAVLWAFMGKCDGGTHHGGRRTTKLLRQ